MALYKNIYELKFIFKTQLCIPTYLMRWICKERTHLETLIICNILVIFFLDMNLNSNGGRVYKMHYLMTSIRYPTYNHAVQGWVRRKCIKPSCIWIRYINSELTNEWNQHSNLQVRFIILISNTISSSCHVLVVLHFSHMST